jgi:dynein heavy chain
VPLSFFVLVPAWQGNILEDENAVGVLQSSKLLSDEISEKQQISDETEAKIDDARAGYKPVAHHSSLLYFVVCSRLANYLVCL